MRIKFPSNVASRSTIKSILDEELQASMKKMNVLTIDVYNYIN